MADNTVLNTGTGGDVIATDDIAGVKYQRVKIVLGADGVNGGDVSSSNAMPVSDNGSSLTVDGSVSVSNFPATQAVSATNLDIRDLTATDVVTVTGGAGQTADVKITLDSEQVAISNFPATQPVSGTVTVTQATAANLNANVTVQNASIPVTDNGGSLTVDNGGTFAVQAAQTGTWNVGLNAGSNAIGSITNTSFTVTQATAANLNATVTGTVAATQSGTWNIGTVTSITNTVTADTELPAAAALADGASNPTTPTVGAAQLAFNGTTFDRVKSTDALAGTGANNTATGILAVGTGPGYAIRHNPTALGTAVNSATTIEVEGGNTMSWGIGTTTTGTFIFEATSDATNWISVEVFDAGLDQWVSGQSLTPTAGKTYHVACGGYRQVRLRVNATLGATVTHVVNVTNSQQLLAGIDTGAAPHNFGYSLIHKDGEYSTTQTGTALWTPTTGRKFVVTDLTITTGGTTSGIVTLWQGAVADTTYTAGTDPAVFRGEFAPSATSKPGVVKSFNVPYISTTTDHILRVTTSAAMTIYVQVNGYEIL